MNGVYARFRPHDGREREPYRPPVPTSPNLPFKKIKNDRRERPFYSTDEILPRLKWNGVAVQWSRFFFRTYFQLTVNNCFSSGCVNSLISGEYLSNQSSHTYSRQKNFQSRSSSRFSLLKQNTPVRIRPLFIQYIRYTG